MCGKHPAIMCGSPGGPLELLMYSGRFLVNPLHLSGAQDTPGRGLVAV